MTHSSCHQHQAPACWEWPRLHHRTRASVPSLPVPWATARPPIRVLQVPLQWETRVGPSVGHRLSSAESPKPPPAYRNPPAQSPQQSHHPLPSLLRVWRPGEDISIPVKPAGTEQPCTTPAAAKIVVLQPLPASKPSREHYPSPAGKTPAECLAAATDDPQGSSPWPAWC